MSAQTAYNERAREANFDYKILLNGEDATSQLSSRYAVAAVLVARMLWTVAKWTFNNTKEHIGYAITALRWTVYLAAGTALSVLVAIVAESTHDD